MTSDSIGHWQQALGQIPLTDYNPVIFILFLRFLFSVTGNTTPFIYCVFQNAMFAIGIADFVCFLRRRGVGRRWLIIGSISLALLPSTYLLELYVSKNPLTAIWALWVVISLVQMLSMSEHYFQRTVWYVKTIVAIGGMYLIRANNAVIIAPLLIMSIWFFVKNVKFRKNIIILAAGVVLMILGSQMICNSVEYTHMEKAHEINRPLFAPVGRAYKAEVKVPDSVSEIAERVLSKENWISKYNRFNSDPLTYGIPRPKYEIVSLKEAFQTYLNMLVVYPDLVIGDRMDGMNCVWNVGTDRMVDIVRATTWLEGDVEFMEATLFENKEALLARILYWLKSLTNAFYNFTARIPIMDIFIWRCGIWIIILFMGIAYLVKNKRSLMIWAILPAIIILLTYVLVIAWQMYFYVWFFPLSVFVFLIGVSTCQDSKAVTETD